MNNQQRVCVTGASGFIAAHAVQQLLEAGYEVVGTVRGKANNYPYLTGLDGAKERLTLVQADLLNDGAFDTIVADCDFVLHTASPYFVDVKDPQKELVEPAVKGTENVLSACAKSPKVKRVVLTSSMAAITDEPDSNKVFSEADWNTRSSLKRNPYYYSKTLAEKAAWDFVDKHASNFDLVVINPFLVCGPSLGPGLNESNKIIKDLLSGVYPAIMSVNWGFVDVRDVAKAHILAMETPEASGRYLVSNENLKMADVVDMLKREGFGNYKLPKANLACSFGDKVMKVLSYTQPKGAGSYMRTHIGREMRYDNSKVKKELGIQFIQAKDTITAAIKDMIKWQHLPQKTA